LQAGRKRKRRASQKMAQRWVVEICYSRLNHLRKLLKYHEKMECSFVAFNHLAAVTIAFRNVPSVVNRF
jgi:hypothetical protein